MEELAGQQHEPGQSEISAAGVGTASSSASGSGPTAVTESLGVDAENPVDVSPAETSPKASEPVVIPTSVPETSAVAKASVDPKPIPSSSVSITTPPATTPQEEAEKDRPLPVADSSAIPPAKPSSQSSKIPTPSAVKSPQDTGSPLPANQPSMTRDVASVPGGGAVTTSTEPPPTRPTPQVTQLEPTKPKETPPDASKPKETPQDVPKPKETPQDVTKPKETPPDVPKPKETPPVVPKPKETPPDVPKPKETPPVVPKPKETPPDVSKPKETPQELPNPKGTPQDVSKPKETPQDAQKPQKTPQDTPKPKDSEQQTTTPSPTLKDVPKPKPGKQGNGSNSPGDKQTERSVGASVTSPQRELALHFSYGSYYSQKVLLALYEKDLAFTPHPMRLDKNEQFEPGFVAINPKAEVPVLKVGDKYITESEVIINYIGRLPISSGNTLVGDSRTPAGQTIQRFRRLLDGISVPLITYGLLHHPHLSKGRIGIPAFQQEIMKELASSKLNTLSALSEKYPEHRAAYLGLSETHAQRYEGFSDEEAVKRELEQLGRVLGTLEEHLAKSKESEAAVGSDCWLCGENFTAADITLLVLLTRLHLLGLDANYLQEDVPALRAYYVRATGRPSYRRLQRDSPGAKEAVVPFLLYNSRRALPYVGGVTAVGAVAGVAYWLYKKVT